MGALIVLKMDPGGAFDSWECMTVMHGLMEIWGLLVLLKNGFVMLFVRSG